MTSCQPKFFEVLFYRSSKLEITELLILCSHIEKWWQQVRGDLQKSEQGTKKQLYANNFRKKLQVELRHDNPMVITAWEKKIELS